MLSTYPPTGEIIIPLSEGTFAFHPADIIRLEASSNYTCIYFHNRRPLLTARVLKEFDALLSCCGFIRTHRSHLVNRKHISGFDKAGNIIMSDDSRAGISRRKKSRVLHRVLAAA
jgi:two-component system, LytTR family, response regulator